MMRSLVSMVVLLSTVTAQAQSPAPHPSSREASLINAFQIMCELELPVFEHIDAHANGMRMTLKSDVTEPSSGNTMTRRKAWVGGLTSGPFFLFDDELSGSKGVSTACAVGGPVPDVETFRAEAIKEMRLAGQPEPEFLPDGSRSYVWNGVEGPGTTLIIRDRKPGGGSGVMVKLLSMVANKPSEAP